MRTAFLIALAAMALRAGLHLAGRPLEGTTFMLVHLLALVLVAYFATAGVLRDDRSTGFPSLMRGAFRSAAVYALLFSVFIWAFYRGLDPGYFPDRIDRMVEMAVAEGQPEEVVRERLEAFFTPFNYASMTFFALLAAGAVNALLVSVLQHRFLRRLR